MSAFRERMTISVDNLSAKVKRITYSGFDCNIGHLI